MLASGDDAGSMGPHVSLPMVADGVIPSFNMQAPGSVPKIGCCEQLCHSLLCCGAFQVPAELIDFFVYSGRHSVIVLVSWQTFERPWSESQMEATRLANISRAESRTDWCVLCLRFRVPSETML